jgi:two-component system sensor histidine kinase KdpD
MVFIMAVVLVASAKGLGPALFTSTLSVLAYDYFFIPPRFTLSISDPQNYLTFAALYLTGVVISLLISTTRHRAETARRQSIRTATLYSMSRDLAVAPDLSSVLASVIGHIQSSFDAYAIVLMPEHGRLRVASASQDLSIEDDEVAVADWVFKHGRTGGLGTDTLPGAKLTYLPMRQGDRVIGVVGVVPKPGQGARTPADERLLEGLVSLASLAVQRVESEGKPPPSEL